MSKGHEMSPAEKNKTIESINELIQSAMGDDEAIEALTSAKKSIEKETTEPALASLRIAALKSKGGGPQPYMRDDRP